MYREFGRMLCETLERPYLQAPIGLTSTTKFLRTLGELLGLDPEPFIAREKHTTIKPLWDLWRSVTQDFFGTASFGIVATDTYARGVRAFLEDDMGLPCHFAFARTAGVKPDNAGGARRRSPRRRRWSCSAPTTNACIWPRPADGRSISPPPSPARSSGATPARPFMGYAGATYLVQEVCNALFDALFAILPLGADLDKVTPTPARSTPNCRGARTRAPRSTSLVEREPVLTRISAAKTLRDQAERRGPRTGGCRKSPPSTSRGRSATRVVEALSLDNVRVALSRTAPQDLGRANLESDDH